MTVGENTGSSGSFETAMGEEGTLRLTLRGRLDHDATGRLWASSMAKLAAAKRGEIPKPQIRNSVPTLENFINTKYSDYRNCISRFFFISINSRTSGNYS